tara:strand:+ start:146 stop:1150 length:1005 start_codon:yes stop_codon:yes gene_type:complete
MLSVLSVKGESNWDQITPSADFRYRFENSKDEAASEGRNRHRIRVRIGSLYQINDQMKFELRLATSDGPSVTTTNSTLGNQSKPKDIYIDRATIQKKYNDLIFNIGRMKQVFTKAGKNQMFWDSDVSFDGLHVNYKFSGAYLNLASFWVDENKASSTQDGADVTLSASQIGYERESGDFAYNLGVSQYHYENARKVGYDPNSTGEGLNFLEVYGELKYAWKYPITIAISSIKNNEAEDNNSSNYVGFSMGKAKKKGSWIVGLNHRTVEANGANRDFADGDFAGKTTDSSGFIYWGKYKLTDHEYLSFGYFVNKKNIDTTEDDYTKLQVDYGVSF